MPRLVACVHLAAVVALFWAKASYPGSEALWFALYLLVQTQIVLLASWATLHRPEFHEPIVEDAALASGPIYCVCTALAYAVTGTTMFDSGIIGFFSYGLFAAALPFGAASVVGLIPAYCGWRWTNDPERGPPLQFSLAKCLIATVIAAALLAFVVQVWKPGYLVGLIAAWTAVLTACVLGVAAGVGPRLQPGLIAATLTFAALLGFALARPRSEGWSASPTVATLLIAAPALQSFITLLLLRLGGWRIDRPPVRGQ
ncbi:MAG TPA: hypothetical protein VGE52_06945 [Pirellulales bacterium]